MLRFPINLTETEPQEWVASWADFPDIDAVTAPTAQTAFETLIDRTFSVVSDIVSRGEHPEPSPEEGRPVISIGIPSRLTPPHLSRLLSVTRRGTNMVTHSWTNSTAYLG